LQHDRYLEALQAADREGVLDSFDGEAQSAIRDYVNDTGTLIVLDGGDEHRAFYEALFGKYAIVSVDLLRRVSQDWYVFAELRMTVRSGDSTFGFNTAEYFLPADDGRFIDRIGHGTDPALVP
jgi:hypothetical protein